MKVQQIQNFSTIDPTSKITPVRPKKHRDMGCEHYNCRNNNLILFSIPDCIKDVVILVDRSENILSGNGLSNWRTLQEFLMRFIAALDVGPSRTRIGIVSFNEASRPELRFSQCSNDQCVKNTIFAIDAPVSVLKISIITTIAIKNNTNI